MEIDLRGETTEVNDYLVKRTQEILKGTAQSLDVQLSIEDLGTVYDIKNDPELVEYLKEVASQCPLVKAVERQVIISRISMLMRPLLRSDLKCLRACSGRSMVVNCG